MIKLSVLYGSQTGNGVEISERIGREGRRCHFDTFVNSMKNYDVKNLPSESFIIFVVSTTGQGEIPDSMNTFWRFLLRKNLRSDSLKNTNYGLIALGDSSYSKFNYTGKKLNRRLCQLGAKSLLQVALADESHDLGSNFVIDSWLKDFWIKALELYPLPPGVSILSSSILLPSKYKVILEAKDRITESFFPLSPNSSISSYSVSRLQRLTALDHWQETNLLEFKESPSFEPGDIVQIYPENLSENVDFFFSLFPNYQRAQTFRLESRESSLIDVPIFKNIEDAVRTYFDIQSIPKRYFFELLSFFSTDLEKSKCLELASSEGQQDLYDYCNRPRRNILEVLYDFRHTTPNIPFEYLFDLIPKIKPRSYSIASSPGSRLQILVAVVKYKSSLVTPRLGLASNMISRLVPDEFVKVSLISGTLKFPSNPSTPVIIVAPGTGIAPFRSLISHHITSESQFLLFFGCRSRHKDFYFEDEWNKLSKEFNFRYFTAFSLDDGLYVQDRLKEEKELVQDILIRQNGYFYIAGKAKVMPDQVMETLETILSECTSGKDYIRKMEASNRLQMETWS